MISVADIILICYKRYIYINLKLNNPQQTELICTDVKEFIGPYKRILLVKCSPNILALRSPCHVFITRPK